MTSKGSKSFEVVCARKIQALWRGYKARKKFYMDKKQYYRMGKGHQMLRQKFYQREISLFTDAVLSDVNARSYKIDDILR